MRYFSIKEEHGGGVYHISKEKFERVTGNTKPYYMKIDGKRKYYAICPKCGNPITLVGFYNKNDTYVKQIQPHGRHLGKSVPELANYDQTAYDLCPYAKPQKYDINMRVNKEVDKFSRNIADLLVNQFDSLVYILQKELGVKFGNNMLKKMLEEYWVSRGHEYIGATLENVPWIFCYMAQYRKNFYGQLIEKDGIVAKTIKKNCSNALLEEIPNSQYCRISNKENQRLNIGFILSEHQSRVDKNGDIKETIYFIIYDEDKSNIPTEQVILRKKIILDTDYWTNLINFGNANRDRKLIEFAEKYTFENFINNNWY